MVPKGARRLLIVGSALAPSVAIASGDPAVIWWMSGAIAIQLVTAAILFWLPSFRPLRRTVMVTYLVLLLAAWLWGLNVPGPDFAYVYAALLGGPVVFLLCVTGVVLARQA